MTPEEMRNCPPERVVLRDGREAIIRPLTPEDGEALGEMYAHVPREHVRFYCPHPLDREHALRNAAKALSPLEVMLVLATPDGGIGGYAWYRWDNPDAERSGFGICLRPEWQSAGAGRLLMTRLLALAKTLGPPIMALTVQLANQRAVALYTSMGFTVVREQMRAPNLDNGFPTEPEYYMEQRVR